MKRLAFLGRLGAAAVAAITVSAAKAESQEELGAPPMRGTNLGTRDEIMRAPVWPHVYRMVSDQGIVMATHLRLWDDEKKEYYLNLHVQRHYFGGQEKYAKFDLKTKTELDLYERLAHQIYVNQILGKRIDAGTLGGAEVNPRDPDQRPEEERIRDEFRFWFS
jgi:hypothetical protein